MAPEPQDPGAPARSRQRLIPRPGGGGDGPLPILSCDTRHADLLFEAVSRRDLQRPILITTNKPLAEWNEVFPSASSVVTLVDRLVHRSEVVVIDVDSYRLKESNQQARPRTQDRAARRKKK